MGCSWYTYAGTLNKVKEGWLLIPKYAQEWAGTDKLEIKCGGEYDDFEMTETPNKNKTFNYLNGDVLVGIFKKLYHNENIDITLKDCYYREHEFPYEDEKLDNLRSDGVFSEAPWAYAPYSLKITKDKSLTYETCKYYSPAGQIWHPAKDDPDYEEHFNQKEYDSDWNYYFGSI